MTLIVAPTATFDASPSTTVEPETVTEDMFTATPPTETAKSAAAAVVACNDSLIVIVTCPPDEFAEAPTKVGKAPSTAIACAPAMLLTPLGTDVDVITLPAASVGALVNTYDDTVRSLLVSSTPTVYVPVNVVEVAFVNTTVSPESSVTVIEAASATVSLIVAVMLIVVPIP